MLVNEVYAAEIRRGAKRDEDRQYVSTQLQAANWLTKSLEQRARTILNVASEIVRRQELIPHRGRLGLKAAQPEDGRRSDRRARVDGLARHCA